MSDDLDDLLRRSMKTLDDQVPAGYFEDLPNRTLVRLGNESMQSMDRDSEQPATGVPPTKAREREDEDSGLHDIRNLASSQRMRLSTKRSTQNPVLSDDVLTSSSAGWKAVALPEPARMVSLPELAELPSAREIEQRDKAARKLEKSERSERKQQERASKDKDKVEAPVEAKAEPKKADEKADEKAAVAVAAVEVPAAVKAEKPASVTPIAKAKPKAAPAKTSGGNRSVLYAVVGVGVAAAAGAAIFVTTRKDVDRSRSAVESEPEAVAAKSDTRSAPAPVVQAIATEQGPGAAAGSGATADTGAIAPPLDEVKPAKAEPKTKAKGTTKIEEPIKPTFIDKTEKTKPGPDASLTKKPGKNPDGSDPSFDDLLKEAGVEGKKEVKVKLDKKSLSGDDIKRGMNSVAAKAQACYAGTQGTANLKLVVDPTGKIQKVTVTGVFAGTSVGNCVEAAAKGATFPAWDGGPQSFGFSYLLSE